MAGAIKEVRKESDCGLFVVDSGRIFPEKGANILQDGKLALRIMQDMGYDAIGLAETDIALGFNVMEKTLKSNPDFPVVISNVVKKDGLNPPFGERYIVLEKNGIKVAVMSVVPDVELEGVPDSSSPVSSLAVISPLTAVEGLIKEVKGKADLVLLLSQLDQDQTFSILRKIKDLPMVAVLGRPLGRLPRKLPKDLAERFIWSSPKGNIIRKVKLSLDRDGKISSFETEAVRLDKSVEEDPVIARLVREEMLARDEMKRKELQERQKKILSMTPEEYIQYLAKEGHQKKGAVSLPVVSRKNKSGCGSN